MMPTITNAITSHIIQKWDEQLLFKILDNIQDVVMVIDSDTTIVYANEAYAKILKVPTHKVLGRKLEQIEPNSLAIRVLRSGEATHNLREYLHSVAVDTIGNAFPLKDGDQIIGCVAIFYEISEVVQLNKELRRTKGLADYLQTQINQLEQQLPQSFKEIGGKNKDFRETLEFAAKVARTNSTALILGESGVGKGVLARAIHYSSERKDKPLIIVNCAAIPEALLESELFGYVTGAFTGAQKGGKLGKFDLAHGGTIFLDEIGDMSLNLQAKLLRVLQEKEFERVGGTKTIKVDIRVIAATNRDLEKMIKEEKFRQDLYYRLNVVLLTIPPLRERKDDIPALCKKFLTEYSGKSGTEINLAPEVLDIFESYEWPGNVRELQNVLEHACIVRSGNEIECRDLPGSLRPLISKKECVHEEKTFNIKDKVAKIERELIKSVLEKCSNNRSEAIKELGISRRAFYEKLHKYDLDSK